MKLAEGMYVRLDRNQGIARLDEYDEETKCFKVDKIIADDFGEETFVLNEYDVLKTSENITDLLQVGDVVTMFNDLYDMLENEIFDIRSEKHLEYIKMGVNIGIFHLINVVTKEQFESMKYEVKEDE